jgi:hypothetical protein
MLLNFPAGLTEFTGPDGVKHKPDANGQVEVAAGDLGPFLAQGFMPDVLALASSLSTLSGFYDSLEAAKTLANKALSGDLVFVVTPATKSTVHGSAASRTVAIALKTAAGDVHTWFNAALAAGVAVAKSSENGTVTIPSTTLTFAAGVASVEITEGGAWAAADTNTLTIAAATVLGYTVASKTSVETMT